MEPIRPSTGAGAPQVAAKVTPVGRGWMLLAVEAGFVLRNAAQGLDLRLTAGDAEALRQGEVTPEAVAARMGHPQHLPPGAVTVAFSPEAMRLSGRMGEAKGGKAGAKGTTPPRRAGPAKGPLPTAWIGAGCLALLVLVIILTA